MFCLEHVSDKLRSYQSYNITFNVFGCRFKGQRTFNKIRKNNLSSFQDICSPWNNCWLRLYQESLSIFSSLSYSCLMSSWDMSGWRTWWLSGSLECWSWILALGRSMVGNSYNHLVSHVREIKKTFRIIMIAYVSDYQKIYIWYYYKTSIIQYTINFQFINVVWSHEIKYIFIIL